MSAARVRSPAEAAGAEPASGYLASEPHYLSVAGRILVALQNGYTLVPVSGNPPADSELLCQALRKAAGSRHRVIGIACGPELTAEGVRRAGSVAATLPAEGGTGTTLGGDAPLFVFDGADRLSDRQIEEICATMQRGGRQNATGVLLGRQGFFARLEEAPVQSCGGIVATRLCFDEIGEDEGIDFLRHQLAARQVEDEPAGIRPVLLRGLAVVIAIGAIGVGASVTLHHLWAPGVKVPSEESAPSPGEDVPRPGVPRPSHPVEPPSPAAPPAASDKFPAASASPTAAPPPSQPPARPNAPVTAAPPRDAAEPQTAPGSAHSPQGARLSPAEIGALMSRGDGFLTAGDIASARLFYERAADAGDAAAALRLGATFDPNFLRRSGVRGNPGDPGRAASWYRRARDLGNAAAAERLKSLEQQPR